MPSAGRTPPAEWTVADLTRVSGGQKLPLREILRHDEGCSFGRWILLYWSDGDRPLWIDFEVIEGIACIVEKSERVFHVGPAGVGPVVFYATEDRELFGRVGVETTTTDLARAVWSVSGFVKWDGCTQIYFPEGPFHYDGQDELRGIFGAICRAQERCYEIYAKAEEINEEGAHAKH